MQQGLMAALVFAVFLIVVSYSLNRRLIGARLQLDPYRLALTASAVLLLAIVAESLINPLYAALAGHKLWEYRVFPLYDSNVSALAVLVWTAYGIHLYFTHQTLQLRLGRRWNNNYGKALLFGFEAPLFFEISGNLTFLMLANSYYAYYLPADLGHLTSLQVVPVYALCVFIGLGVLRRLERLPRHGALPAALFAAGLVYLLAG